MSAMDCVGEIESLTVKWTMSVVRRKARSQRFLYDTREWLRSYSEGGEGEVIF